MRDALRLGVSWAAGHTTTIALPALVTITAGFRLPERLWPIAEAIVAVFLMGLGLLVIATWARGRWLLLVSAALWSAVRMASHDLRWVTALRLASGIASVAVGAMMVYETVGRR